MTEENDSKNIVYLKDDDVLNKQNFVCLSFITPELIKNCKVRGLKVRGVYATEEEARNRCRELNKIDPDFNIYVAPVGTWVPWSDDPEKAEDTEYANEELNNLMKAYKENQVKAKMLHEQRKQDLIEKNIRESEEQKKKNEKESKNSKTESNNSEVSNIEVANSEVSNIVDNSEVSNDEYILNKKRLDRNNDLTAENFENIDELENNLLDNTNNIENKQEFLDNKKDLLDETEDIRDSIRKEIQKAKETFDKIKNKN